MAFSEREVVHRTRRGVPPDLSEPKELCLEAKEEFRDIDVSDIPAGRYGRRELSRPHERPQLPSADVSDTSLVQIDELMCPLFEPSSCFGNTAVRPRFLS